MIFARTLFFIGCMFCFQGAVENTITSFTSGNNNGYSWSSSSSMDNGPGIVYILVSDKGILNLSKGGMTSLQQNGQLVSVFSNGQRIDVNEYNGPYVVTTEPDGVLKTRPATPEELQMQEDYTRRQAEQWARNIQQSIQQSMQGMFSNPFFQNLGMGQGAAAGAGAFPFGKKK